MLPKALVLSVSWTICLSKIPTDTLNISWSSNYQFTSNEILNPYFVFINDNEFLLCYQDSSKGVCHLGSIAKNSNIQYSSPSIYHLGINTTNAKWNVNILQISKTNYLLSDGYGQILQTDITNSSVIFNNNYYIYDSNFSNDTSQLISITDDEFIVCYTRNNDIYCKYGMIDNNNDIIFGPEAQVFSDNDPHIMKNAQRMFGKEGNKMLKLSNTQFVICYIALLSNSDKWGYCSIGTIQRSKVGKNNATIYYMGANEFNTAISGTNNINLFNYDPEFDIIICYTVNDDKLNSLGLCSVCGLHNQNGFFPDVACPGATWTIVDKQDIDHIATPNILYHYVSSALPLQGELLACFSNINKNNSYCSFGHIYVNGDGTVVIRYHDTPEFLNGIVSGVQVALFPSDKATMNQRENEFVFNDFYVLLCYHTNDGGDCRIGSVTGYVTDGL